MEEVRKIIREVLADGSLDNNELKRWVKIYHEDSKTAHHYLMAIDNIIDSESILPEDMVVQVKQNIEAYISKLRKRNLSLSSS
jgi:hypothetical protein